MPRLCRGSRHRYCQSTFVGTAVRDAVGTAVAVAVAVPDHFPCVVLPDRRICAQSVRQQSFLRSVFSPAMSRTAVVLSLVRQNAEAAHSRSPHRIQVLRPFSSGLDPLKRTRGLCGARRVTALPFVLPLPLPLPSPSPLPCSSELCRRAVRRADSFADVVGRLFSPSPRGRPP